MKPETREYLESMARDVASSVAEIACEDGVYYTPERYAEWYEEAYEECSAIIDMVEHWEKKYGDVWDEEASLAAGEEILDTVHREVCDGILTIPGPKARKVMEEWIEWAEA